MASLGAFRLRLVIRRYSLPEVKVVWPCTPSDDLTISRLLILVNEVIPLESQDWGLEDYAVELADTQGSSFECLHFQRVNQVLKHDDQVLIRSLLTDDLKQRRVSGRDQISADGKHLFDGVPFGRPLLKAPRGRPPVTLPPRKRARIEFYPDEADEEHDEPQQLLLEQPSDGFQYDEASDARVRALFDNDDDMSGEDEEDPDFGADDESMGSDDQDGEPDVSQLGGLEPDELEGLKQDNEVCKEGAVESSDEESDDETSSSGSSDESEDEPVLKQMQLLKADNRLGADESEPGQLLEPDNSASALESIRIDWSEKLMILRTAFPLTPLPSIRKEFLANGEDLRRTYNTLCLTNNPVQSFDQMMDDALCGPDSSHQLQQQAQPRSRPLIQEVESSDEAVASAPLAITGADGKGSSGDDSSDSDFGSDSDSESDSSQVSGDGSSGHGNTNGENGTGVNEEEDTVIINRNIRDSSSDSDSSEEESSSDESANEALQDLTNDLLEDSEDESSESEDSSDSDSSSGSSSSSSDSSSDADSSDDEPAPAVKAAKKKQIASQATQTAKAEPKQDAPTEPTPVPPGKGLARTRKRNERRRQLLRMKQNGNKNTESEQKSSEADSLEVRRQALLQSLGITQMDTSADGPSGPDATSLDGNKADTAVEIAKVPGEVTNGEAPPTQEKGKKGDEARMRLDVDASARLIFSGMGRKTPKTQEEKEKFSEGLMKNVRPSQNARLAEEKKIQEVEEEPASDSSSSVSSDSSSDEEQEDSDAWKKKISYRAVECVQKGITLSEPPFPFKQRWDPQQHYSVVRKRKREEAEATPFDESFVGDDTQWNYEEEEGQSKPSKKRKHKGKQQAGAAAKAIEDVTTLDYDDPPAATTAPDVDMAEAEDAGQADTQVSQLSDLPELPEDVSSLPLLKRGEAVQGMVITWKEMKLSKTLFQPEINSVTALVLEAESDLDLKVILAVRDRDQDERQYDAETGERIYGKFDAPSDDEDEVQEDDGHRTVSMLNMIEARIVQQPLEQPVSSEEVITEPQSQPPPVSPSQQLNGEMCVDESIIIPSGQGPQQPENPFHQLISTSSITTSREVGSANVSKALIVEVVEGMEAPAEQQEAASSAMAVDGQDAAPGETADSQMMDKETQESNPKPAVSTTTETEKRNGIAQESVASGRQPQIGQGEEPADMIDMDQDSIIPETLRDDPKIETQKDGPDFTSDSSEPIMSLEEIWSQPRNDEPKSPPKSEKSAIKERNAKINSDPAYDEAMAKLDNGEVSDEDFQSESIKRRLFSNANQESKLVVEIPDKVPVEAKDLTIVEPSPRSAQSARKKRTRSSPFVIPAGSQVVDLESDAPSPVNENGKGSVRGRGRGRPRGVKSPGGRGGAVTSSPPSENTRHRKGANGIASQASPARGRGRKASRGARGSMTQK